MMIGGTMPKRASHRARIVYHVRRRARQRYGLKITAEDNAAMVKAIQTGQARFISKVSNRVTAFDVECKGVSIRVLYDNHEKVILTVLTKDMKL